MLRLHEPNFASLLPNKIQQNRLPFKKAKERKDAIRAVTCGLKLYPVLKRMSFARLLTSLSDGDLSY